MCAARIGPLVTAVVPYAYKNLGRLDSVTAEESPFKQTKRSRTSLRKIL